MLLREKLLECFPDKSTEKVEVEIGYVSDMVKIIITESFKCEVDINEFVALITKKIEEMNSMPAITAYYPFGEPKTILPKKRVVVYEQDFINIKFK